MDYEGAYRAHGWQIEIHSKLNVGTSLTVLIKTKSGTTNSPTIKVERQISSSHEKEC